MPILRPKCEELASKAIKEAEEIGIIRDLISRIERGEALGINASNIPADYLKAMRDDIDNREAKVLDLIVQVVQCEK